MLLEVTLVSALAYDLERTLDARLDTRLEAEVRPVDSAFVRDFVCDFG